MDSRESAVDRALGGMEEGSRMLSPEGSFSERGRGVPGSMRSPETKTGVTAPSGSFPFNVGVETGPAVSQPGPVEEPLGSGGGELTGGGTGGGELTGGGGLEEPAGGTEEPVAGPSGGGSIIEIDADVNVDGGNVDANLDAGVDTEAGSLLELDADTDVAADAPVAVEVDSAESAVIESNLGVEEGINDAPASGEAEAGLEADVDASGESDEPIDNPADGLSL